MVNIARCDIYTQLAEVVTVCIANNINLVPFMRHVLILYTGNAFLSHL